MDTHTHTEHRTHTIQYRIYTTHTVKDTHTQHTAQEHIT